jgi:predicted transport protein
VNFDFFIRKILRSTQLRFCQIPLIQTGHILRDRVSAKVDWSGARLICVAGDFQKWDQHAVKQMNRTIDLISYRRFSDDLLLLELLTATTAKNPPISGGAQPSPVPGSVQAKKYKTVSQQIAEAPAALSDLYHAVASYLEAMRDDVQVKTTDFYVAFRRLKNFACVEVRNQAGKVLVFLRVNPHTAELVPGFSRDVRNIGHFGTGDLELTLQLLDDFEKAKPLFDLALQNS